MELEQLEAEKVLVESEEKDKATIEKWTKRFTMAERFRRPYMDKNLRMYSLYRGHRKVTSYAYNSNIMPPIGYEIIETIKPRLAAAKVNIRITPTKKEDLNSPAIGSWDNLVNYNLDVMGFQDLKIAWIDSMLKYGNGTAQLFWKGDENGDPSMDIVDNWLLYVDPSSRERFKGAGWLIKWGSKRKSVIIREEKDRGEEMRLYDEKKLEKVQDKTVINDPRKDRYEINTKKMSTVDDGSRNNKEVHQDSSTTDKNEQKKEVEIWECMDLVDGTITTIMNREVVARNEDSAYKDINDGNTLIDLPNTQLGWEYYAMATLEPVETTIHEIADGRNQAMDDIIFSLDPIRKIRKGAGINADDILHAPGATWELANVNDVTIERPPEISRMWIEKDEMLRSEIQSALALSEYTQGNAHSGQEPAEKVDLLLMQSNIRFSLIVRQMEVSFTQLVNALIQMNRKFLGEKKLFRIVGDDVDFKEFSESDKQVIVDAKVEIDPKKEKTPDQKEREILELYKIFVVDDQPDPNDPEAVKEYKLKKREFQKMILNEFDKGEYEDVLLPKIRDIEAPPQTPPEAPVAPEGAPIEPVAPEGIGGPEGGLMNAEMPVIPEQTQLPQPIPLLEPEAAGLPTSQTSGLLERLKGLFTKR